MKLEKDRCGAWSQCAARRQPIARRRRAIPVHHYMFLALAMLGLAAPGLIFAAGRGIEVQPPGGTADGNALCTAAIQQAIDQCAAAGGGTVYFPPGKYLSGTLRLKSRVTLWLETGATLLGSTNPKDYPEIRPSVRSYTDTYVCQSLIYGEDLDQVGIGGSGTIDGNGSAFRRHEYKDRPYVIRMINCRDVHVENVTLQNSPMWMEHYLACDRLRVTGVRVFNHVSYNNDGIDVDGCHDVVITDCMFDVDDDALCLKSTLDRACENVTVGHCVLSSHCNAIKAGTESNGGFKNITISDCVIVSPRHSKALSGLQRGLGGIALEVVDGGKLENVTVSHIAIQGVNVPIFLRLGNRARPFTADGPKPAPGIFRRVILSDIVATSVGRTGCSITGLPGHFIEDVQLANISVSSEGGGEPKLADRDIPERPEAYPESSMFGDVPAYGFYCRHVRGLKLRDVHLETIASDARHAVVCDDVRNLTIDGLEGPAAAVAAAFLRLRGVESALISACRVRAPLGRFLRVEGVASSRVLLQGNDLTAVRRVTDLAEGVPLTSVQTGPNFLAPDAAPDGRR